MTERDSLAVLAEQIALAFEPLAQAIASPENFTSFMLELGWDLRQLPEPIRNLAAPLQVILDIIESGEVDTPNVLELIDAIKSLINSINQITSSPNNLFPSSVDADEFKAEFPAQLVQFLIIEHMLDYLPQVGSVLKTLGVIRIEQVEATATRLAYESLELNWQDLINVFNDPFIILKNAYQWGSSGFEPDQVLENILDMGEAFGVNLRFERLETAMEDFLTKDAIALEDAHSWVLRAPIIEDRVFGTGVELGVAVFMLPKTATEEAGFSILPYGTGEFQEEIELSDDLVLQVEAAMDLAGGIGVLIRPNKGIEVFTGIISAVDSGVTLLSSGFLAVGIKNQSNTDSQLLLLGSEDGSRLQVRRPSVVGRLQLDAQGKTDLYVEGEIEGNLVIAPGQADGFLQKILPPDGISSRFDFTIGFSYLQGFYFRGSATIEITIPIHESIGPINIESVYLTIKIRDDAKIDIVLAASVGARIGPVSASIQRIGIKTALSFPDNGGNLGPIQLDGPRFKPPIGAGLAITTDPVVGGGYLEFDPDNERYAGMLQLSFGEIELMAIGLITTRMPDGSKGFSMLLIITAEFDPPITLPYNFNLSGVGGLIGIHRTMLVDVIRQGIRNRTIDSILFPEDPILNAPRIISDLRTVFPPTEGRYVMGPMAILNWGNPPLIRAEIGILIELPSPVRIAILGQLTLELPKGRSQANAADQEDDRVLVEIHLDLLGIVDFDKKTFSFDATLYDSRIAEFTLSGDSAMRLSWGDNPNFALSVGGLHPRFTPPPNFPTLNRLQLSLGSGNNPRINLDNYIAVTSNSTQFGAKLEVYARKGSFSVQGYMGFDVLFIFSPFSFIADIGAGVAVKKGGTTLLSVTLDLSLSGPKPWHARGKATFKVLFIKVRVRFDETWGRGRPEPLQPIDPWPILKAALDDQGNWVARLPVGSQPVVTLRKGAAQDVAVLHPMGALEIRQRVLPFEIEMDLFGNAPIAGEKSYSIAELWTGPEEPNESNRLAFTHDKEHFARAQFESLSDSEKMSKPSFEKFDAIIVSHMDEVEVGAPIDYELKYEPEVLDENGVAHKVDEEQYGKSVWNAAQYYLAGSAARAVAIRNSGLRAYAPPGEVVTVGLVEEDYKIVNTENLELEAAIEQDGKTLTHAEASRALEGYLAAYPERRGELQVVPSHEVAA